MKEGTQEDYDRLARRLRAFYGSTWISAKPVTAAAFGSKKKTDTPKTSEKPSESVKTKPKDSD